MPGVTTQFVFANFFESELVTGLTASSTTMMISPSDAAKLPIITAGSGMQAQLTIWDGQLPPEIVGATINDQSGTMTILRAQEGTVAQAWSSGTQVRSSITALVLNSALAAYFDIGTVLSAHFLSLSGGTLTGPLVLAGPPTVPLHAATKAYVDSVQGTGLPTTGGTMTGPINMNTNLINNLGAPVSNNDAVNKIYVDNAVGNPVGTGPLAPKVSPPFTGTPTAPTPTFGDNSTTLATTAFVQAAIASLGGGASTGDLKLTIKSVADPGWLMLDDTTIGWYNGNATHRDPNNSTTAYLALFSLLWNLPATWVVMFNAANTTAQARGANATTDHNAGCCMSLPKVLGRALAIAGAGAGLTPRVLAQFLGEENHILLGNESVPHRHVGVMNNPGASITQVQIIAGGGLASVGPAEGNDTGGRPASPVNWAADSFGGTSGPRFWDGNSPASADRTANALTLNDSVYFGHAGGPIPGSNVADGHNNMPPESFINAMVKL